MPKSSSLNRQPPASRGAAPGGVLSLASILKPPRVTLGELAYENLRDAILTTRLMPGTPVSENELSQAISVSRTPIREAIRRLAEERLVEVTPQSGTTVSKINAGRARQAIFVRQSIECAVLAQALPLGESGLAMLEAQVGGHLRAIEAGNTAAAAGMDEEFHEILMRACGFPEATTATRAISADIVRILFLSGADGDYYASVAGDHQRLVALMRQGARAEATELLRRHIGGFAVDQEKLRAHFAQCFDPDEA